MTEFQLRRVGERAVLAEFSARVDLTTSAQVRALAAHLDARADVAETVPGICTLLVVLTGGADRATFLRDVAAYSLPEAPIATDPRILHVPVAYGGPSGPDLPEVARRCGLDERQVIALHAGVDYQVLMLGFAPGFPYLGILADPLRLPRRASPRPRVPAGSVGIADIFSGIYPTATAGGWHLLGRTGLRLFDPTADPSAAFAPGDRVRFVPVPHGEAADQAGAPAHEAPVHPHTGPRSPVLAVRSDGIAATIQDVGRFGHRKIGVPWSGPMDPRHHALANRRAGNPPETAAVEMTWPAPVLEAVDDAVCALAGPGWEPVVDGRVQDAAAPLEMRRGAVLEFRRSRAAMWAYLAVGGGIDVPEVLGSRATYPRGGIGGLEGRALAAGDILGRGEVAYRPVRIPAAFPVEDPLTVQLILGPQDAHIGEEGLRRLLGEVYTVTAQVDRVGYRLAGPAVPHRLAAEVLPQGTLPGAVQVPPDGQPIVLLVDGPTTGGYPHVGTVASADLGRLAQAGPGSRIRFRAVAGGSDRLKS